MPRVFISSITAKGQKLTRRDKLPGQECPTVSPLKGVIMKTKFMARTVALLMTLVLAGAVQAQKAAVVSFNGIEIATGHEEPGEAYGWMCYARTTGTFPGNLTLTMDYQGIKAPSTSSDVTGGSWTLPVYTSSKFSAIRPILMDPYQGVLFGSIDGGSVAWSKDGLVATIELKLTIRGGTQAMTDLHGDAILYGTVTYGEKGGGPFVGTIYFTFQ